MASSLRRDLLASKDCFVDITLKDVETVQRDPNAYPPVGYHHTGSD